MTAVGGVRNISRNALVSVTSKMQLFMSLRVKVSTKTDGTVYIHPKSVNVEETEFHYNWLVYHLKMRTSSVSECCFSTLIHMCNPEVFSCCECHTYLLKCLCLIYDISAYLT